MIVIIGLVPEGVGNAEASPIQTPGVSCSSPLGLATLVCGSRPMRHEPIWWAANMRRPPARAGIRCTRAMKASRSSPTRHSGEPCASTRTRRAPAATWARICTSSACAMLRRSTGSVISYQGTAIPCSSIVTRPCPWSRMRPMKVAPSRKSASAALCWAAVVHGSADAPRPVVYWTPSIRKP